MTTVYKVSISFCCETPLQPHWIEALSPHDLEIAAAGACLLIVVGDISYAQGLRVHLLETSRLVLSLQGVLAGGVKANLFGRSLKIDVWSEPLHQTYKSKQNNDTEMKVQIQYIPVQLP